MKTVDCDYLVVGSGMAGLMSALHLAAYGKVVVVTKARLQDCNSNFAPVMSPAWKMRRALWPPSRVRSHEPSSFFAKRTPQSMRS